MTVTTTNKDGEEIPKTDICENCEREILPELERVTGKHDLINQSRETDEGFMPVTGGTATVRFSCQCSSVEVEFGPGSASAWDFPDGWMWEDSV